MFAHMKYTVALGWLVFVVCACTGSVGTEDQATKEIKRYIVRGVSVDYLKQEGEVVQEKLSHIDASIANLSGAAAADLKKGGAFVEEDFEVNLLGKPVDDSGKPSGGGCTTQPAQSTPWGINRVNAPSAHAITKGAGVLVCVVDTGIQKNHPDLPVGITGENFVQKGATVDPNAWGDDNSHGTHVSGTIAALDNSIGVIGVAPQANLRAAKVLNSRGSGYTSWVADGILSCVANGADVINMSLGSSGDSSVLHDAVIAANNAGLIVVAAAGNESGAVSYPGAYTEAKAISAINSSDQFASFSNFGPQVDFAAPGVSVLSTTKGSCYATYSGTSMATPHAAGVFALAVSVGRSAIAADFIPTLTVNQQGAGVPNARTTVE